MVLLKNKLISFEEALRQASNPDDFKLKVSGVSSTSNLSWDPFEKMGSAPPAECWSACNSANRRPLPGWRH